MKRSGWNWALAVALVALATANLMVARTTG